MTHAPTAISVRLVRVAGYRRMASEPGIRANARPQAAWATPAQGIPIASPHTATPGMAHRRPINVCPEGALVVPTTRAAITTSASIKPVTD